MRSKQLHEHLNPFCWCQTLHSVWTSKVKATLLPLRRLRSLLQTTELFINGVVMPPPLQKDPNIDTEGQIMPSRRMKTFICNHTVTLSAGFSWFLKFKVWSFHAYVVGIPQSRHGFGGQKDHKILTPE